MTRVLLAAVLLAVSGCSGAGSPPPMPEPPSVPDIHSHARPAEARVTHVSLNLEADFPKRLLRGTATLTVARTPQARTLVLDTQGLRIERVFDQDQHPLPFALRPAEPVLGQALDITLSEAVERVTVQYQTSQDAAALQWLTPAQTSGKSQPYLYSQGQAILTRSWIPTQDSPGIRQTYDARITVPTPLKAVMAAEMLAPGGRDAGQGRRTFEFRMEHAIPPYLIALAVGDLSFRELGPRTGVYTEPAMLESAASELVDLEKMITAAEALGGPYRWGRYDVLVLPPSFPFGGMENPRLTFATPTILAGDRSLVSLLAHELAHSWSGNLVSNATWGDFWLNEGVTTYFENRIMEALYGADRAAMLAVLGRGELARAMQDLPAADTRLQIDLKGRDPDDGMTAVPYEKGAALFHTIEQAVGRDRFDPWLRGYFNRHAFTSITTGQFVTDLQQQLLRGDTALEARLDLQPWLTQPGLPPTAVVPSSPALAEVESEARRFGAGAAAGTLQTAAWSTQQWQHFLEQLRTARLAPAQMRDLDTTLALAASGNSEILFAWLRVAIARQYDPALPAVERFLSSQGRRKFLKPLYEDLMQTPWGQPIARRVYSQARPSYHSVSSGTIDTIVE
ncbi:MAG: M1 family metallopeptidase [Acidobacteria bacterium]|nr:M1 family metallopeptidase [Acidobacteriota bacterium]